jgi:hypothetical protein
MTGLAEKWTGRLYGTNTGNLFIEMNQEVHNVSGVLRILDHIHGITIYNFSGTFKEKLILDCTPDDSNTIENLGKINVEGVLTPEGNLRGTWHSTIGTAGIFDAYPHYIEFSQSISEAEKIPEQIFNKNIVLGSIRLFSYDIKSLINFVGKDFKQATPIITYNLRGNQVTKYSTDFVDGIDNLGEIKYLKISIQEHEANGINKIIVLEFTENGISEIRVSGIEETWVVGKAESIFEKLKPKQNILVTTYKKYGLNLNSIIFLSMLILIPEVQALQDRTIFVVLVFILLGVLLWLHRKFIPNTIIYLTGKEPSLLSQIWPTILSFLIAVSSSLLAAWIFYSLTKQ